MIRISAEIPEALREYVSSVWEQWGRKVSGRTLAIIGLLLLLVTLLFPDRKVLDLCATWGSRLTLAAAGWLLLVAQYETWKDKREGLVAARAELDAVPDMRGTVWYLLFTGCADKAPTTIQFWCDFTNHGRQPCEISKMAVFIKSEDGPIDPAIGEQCQLVGDPYLKLVGYGEVFRYNGGFNINLPLGIMRRCSVKIFPIDSFGVEYRNVETNKSPGSQ